MLLFLLPIKAFVPLGMLERECGQDGCHSPSQLQQVSCSALRPCFVILSPTEYGFCFSGDRREKSGQSFSSGAVPQPEPAPWRELS